MKKLFIFLWVLGTAVLQTEAQQFQWAKQFDGETNSAAKIIKASQNSNMFIAGDFKGTIDFDGGEGTALLTSLGENDLFIEKTDMEGNLIWVKQFGGVDDEFVRGMSIDADENIYLTGSFKGTIDLDPGEGEALYVSAGGWDIFVLELDAEGNYLWSGQMGGMSEDYGVNIEVASSDNIYVSGYFAGTGDFDPSPDMEFMLTATNQSCFVEKLNSSKELLWAGVLGGPGIDYLDDMFIDGNENIYTTGGFAGAADFDLGAGSEVLVAVGDRDIFISKLNTDGGYVWAVSMGGPLKEFGQGISVDPEDNVYIAGNFQGTVDFNPASGDNFYLTSMGDYDIFIGKLDADAGLLWMKQIGGVGNQVPYRLTLDAENNIYTTGYFEETVDFDPGEGEFILSSLGGIDFYLNKLDNSGVHDWTVGFGNVDSDRGFSLFSQDDYIYTGGLFAGNVDFDPSANTHFLNGSGVFNGFVYKLETSYLGVEEQTVNYDVSIYPNPTKLSASLSFNENTFSGRIEVFSILGKKIIEKTINNKKEVQIELGDKTGLFFVKLTNSAGAEKIVKLLKE